MNTHGFVGNLLIHAGIIDATGLERALQIQSQQKVTLGRACALLGLASETDVAARVASALHLEHLDGPPPLLAAETTALLPADFCRKRRVAPLGLNGNVLRLAVVDPMDYSVQQDVDFRTGRKSVAVVVTQTYLEQLLDATYPENAAAPYDMLANINPAGELEAAEEYELLDQEAIKRDTKLPPIVRLVNLILSDAAASGASDIHIEPQETSLQVRQRIDGLLREVLTIPHHLKDQTISRLKIISGMDIAERRKPQDGRSRLRFEGRRIDLRVSTLPTQFGEKVVIRLLNLDKAILPMDQLGFAGSNLQLLRSFLSRSQGMILVTGPTGSGKTSTLYAALNSIKSPTNNIVTLEDPIEFQIPGINQMQLNTRAGVTFASGLRSILRQDPNVILVGEIRDQETADIALQASQTGHLVLSTLHTNDAPATITRLFDLGVPPFLVASSLIGIMAQRLVRRTCTACAIVRHLSADAIERAGGASRLPSDGRWTVGTGCDQCGESGMKGRLAIHEILQITDEIRELISNRASELEIKKAARRAGMRTLAEDGIAKAAQGLTTLEEVFRVVSHSETEDSARETRTTPAKHARTAEISVPQSAAPVAPAAQIVDEIDVSTERRGKRRVLVVEDSPTVASVVKYFLEIEGFDVVLAENGAVGLDAAFRERPDVIVSDVNMPGMGGVEMVKALRADARTSDVRVLMLTSEASVESETEGLAAGADDYILKPVEPRRLAARIKLLLDRSKQRASGTAAVRNG